MQISSIVPGLEGLGSIENISGKENVGNFGEMLKQNINDTNALLNKADQYQYDFAVLKTRDLHEVMMAAEEAGIALNYTMQVRNKAIESYQEMMRMQI